MVDCDLSEHVKSAYDRLAVEYAENIGDELAYKALDRELLMCFANMVRGPN